MLEKGAITTQWRQDNLFNKWCWENWIAICQKVNLEKELKSFRKINSKLRTKCKKCKTIKFLEVNIGNIQMTFDFY